MAASPTFDSADPLTRVLHFVRVSGTFYCHTELREPWGLFMPPMPGCMWFHCVNDGRAQLEVEGRTHELERGSFALVPHGRGHRLRSARRVATPNVVELPHDVQTERYAVLRHGGDGARATLLCGVVRLDPTVGAELERSLPPVLQVEARAAPHGGWMDTTLALMAAESKAPGPGGETIVTRLADVLVVQAIRAWLEADPSARRGWLGALRDPKLGPALAAVWTQPSRDWTVAGLAKVAAMSRSAFAARFEELVGEPPMKHLARVRMRLASEALFAGQASVAQIAERAGYRSEAAFSRAFKRFTGAPPGSLRRAARLPGS